MGLGTAQGANAPDYGENVVPDLKLAAMAVTTKVLESGAQLKMEQYISFREVGVRGLGPDL